MGCMNATPFIDVFPVEPIARKSTVSIEPPDRLFRNDWTVSPEEFEVQGAEARAWADNPVLRFFPASLARHETAARTVSLIDNAGATALVMVGDAQHCAPD